MGKVIKPSREEDELRPPPILVALQSVSWNCNCVSLGFTIFAVRIDIRGEVTTDEYLVLVYAYERRPAANEASDAMVYICSVVNRNCKCWGAPNGGTRFLILQFTDSYKCYSMMIKFCHNCLLSLVIWIHWFIGKSSICWRGWEQKSYASTSSIDWRTNYLIGDSQKPLIKLPFHVQHGVSSPCWLLSAVCSSCVWQDFNCYWVDRIASNMYKN